MVYNGIELATMGELFNMALTIAKSGDSTECSNFIKTYAEHIYTENSRDKVPTMEDAYKCAKSNLGYFSGYYDSKTYELINKSYNAIHPIFGGNPFNVSPEDAYQMGKELVK